MDGNLQLTHHLVVTEFSDDVLCDVFILQAIVGEVFGLDAAVKQTAHLLHHAMVETLMQTGGDAAAALVAVDGYADDDTVDRRHLPQLGGMLEVVGLDLYGADGALARIYVGFVVHRRARLLFQFHEHVGQLVEILAL